MSAILGRDIPKPFEPYTEILPVKPELSKWVKAISQMYNLHK